MILTLRALFLSRELREKLALVAFLAIAVMIWASSFSSAVSKFWHNQRATTAALKTQDDYLANRETITAAANRAADQLVPARTLDGTHLFTTIQQLATEAGLSRTLGEDAPTKPVTNGQLSVWTLRFRITNADWEALSKFYLALHQRSPYISIEQVALAPNPANGNQVTFTAMVSSVEILR